MESLIKYIVLVSILLCSCSEEETSLPLLDFDNPEGSIDLNINDLLDDIRLIKLEMIDDDPLSSYAFQWIGKEHLLYFDREKVYQYTSEGSFVRILMNRGQGPDEFSYIIAYDVDENKDLLYWSNQGVSGKIFVTDLKSGEHLPPIALPYDTRFSYGGLKIIDENTLLCLSNQYADEKIIFYYLGLDGTVKEGLPRHNPDLPGAGRGTFLGKNRGSGKFNFLGDADTLFSIEGTSLDPIFSMLVSDRFNYEDNLEGHMLYLWHLGSRYSIISKNMLIVHKGEDGTSMRSEEAGDFMVDMQSFSLLKVKSWMVDYLAYSTEDLSMTAAGDFAIIKFDAIKLKAIAEDALLQDNLKPAVTTRLEQLSETITENDNPYLLVGRIK